MFYGWKQSKQESIDIEKTKISYMSELRYDNVTAVSYVNNMGDIKSQTCNNITYRLWDFCAKN